MKYLLLCSFAIFFLQLSECKHWALVVAGSNGWFNYRHQADVCHSYHILHKHGVPDENIVVMMYDDIAYSAEKTYPFLIDLVKGAATIRVVIGNPTPGTIINQPNGPNVYKGVVKDYIKEDVTPENFLNVLKGNKEAMKGIGSGKVIDSGPDDNVFVYFADHGAPNIIAFPTSELHAKDLNDAIMYMSNNKKYKQMVFYIEACESGSMFMNHKLRSDINVFATTAANGAESSYACYYDSRRQTFLGDVYSVKWLENSDQANLNTETLTQQFKTVKAETNESHVTEYGDLTMGSLVLGLFQGESTSLEEVTESVPITDVVPSPDVPVEIFLHRMEDAKTKEEHDDAEKKLRDELNRRRSVVEVVRGIVHKLATAEEAEEVLNKPAMPYHEECYKHSVSHFRKHCFDFNRYEHALRHVYVLANLCDKGFHTQRILDVIEQSCPVAF